MRYALFGITLAACSLAFAAEAPRIVRMPIAAKQHVDLDDEAKLEAIRRDNPRRYQRIVAAIDAAQVTSCETLPQTLRTRFDILDTRCSAYTLLTSFPPKSRVTFVIDDTQYSLNVVQRKLAPSKMVPALGSR